MQRQAGMSIKAVKERRFRQREKQRKRFESPMRKFIEVKYPNIFQEYTQLYDTLNRNHPDIRNLTKTSTFRRWLDSVNEVPTLDILSTVIRETLDQDEAPKVRHEGDEIANHESGDQVYEADDEAASQADEVDEAANQTVEVASQDEANEAASQADEVDEAANQVDEVATQDEANEAANILIGMNNIVNDKANKAANILIGMNNIVNVLMNVEDQVDDIINELMQDQGMRDILVEPEDEGIEINPLDDIAYDIEPFDFNLEVENYDW